MRFDNQTVMLVGGTGGIGMGIATAFVSLGANVISLSKNENNIEKCKAIAKEKGFEDKIKFYKVDISKLDDFCEWFGGLISAGQTIDILVNGAGIYPSVSLVDVSEDGWDKIFDINLKANFFIMQAVANKMIPRKKGVIINIGSFAGEMPSIGHGIYSASKAALNSLTKSMAAELAPFNIRVNGISPGVIRTDMTKSIIADDGDVMKNQVALRRFGDASEVADVVLFLASDSASYITGEIINVTGGKYIVQNPWKAWRE